MTLIFNKLQNEYECLFNDFEKLRHRCKDYKKIIITLTLDVENAKHDYCRRPILSQLLVSFNFYWTLGPSMFEFGPRTYSVMLFIYFVEFLSHFVLVIYFMFTSYLIVICR